MARLLGLVDLDFLTAALEPLPDCPFFVKDANLRYVAANSSMARLCGLRHPSDLIGIRAGDIFPPHLAQYYEQLDLGVLTSGAGVTDQLHLTAPRRRRQAALLFTRTPVPDAQGQTVGICGTARWLADTPQLRRLSAAADHLRDNFSSPLQLERLAALAGISSSQLERDFSRIFQMSLREYQQRIRLSHALRMLTNTGMPIAQIALACGYSDQSAFARRFRSQMGGSPSSFRRIRTGQALTPPGTGSAMV